MTPATSSSGLVTNPIPQQPCNPPKRDDWDCLFQPMFDEYFNPPTIDVSQVRVAAAPRVIDLADSPVSTVILKYLAINILKLVIYNMFLKMIQVRLNTPVRNIRTDNGTEFVNQTLRSYYESVGISHETSVARSPQQNGVVERRNHTLVEAARTMLIYAKAPLFLWAEAVATACYTQNRSIIRCYHGKTPYELLHERKPDLSYLRVFGALCYPNNDSEDLGKLQAKADIGIFIGYAPKKKAYRIYNRCTRKIIKTIHVDFDELTAMASEQLGSGPGL
ncbi:retrovirus-related pol polyprotein from transposon TNT 1-94 [Tanacetum coccineum]